MSLTPRGSSPRKNGTPCAKITMSEQSLTCETGCMDGDVAEVAEGAAEDKEEIGIEILGQLNRIRAKRTA